MGLIWYVNRVNKCLYLKTSQPMYVKTRPNVSKLVVLSEKVVLWQNVARPNVTWPNFTQPNVAFITFDLMSPDRMSPDWMSTTALCCPTECCLLRYRTPKI
jgi:hypothetical protein